MDTKAVEKAREFMRIHAPKLFEMFHECKSETGIALDITIPIGEFAAAYASHVEESRWISVEERLPEVGVHVLVFNGRVHEDYLGRNDHEFMQTQPSQNINRPLIWSVQCERAAGKASITHWMEIPIAPKDTK